MSPKVESNIIATVFNFSFLNAVWKGFLEVFRIDLVEFEVRKHGTELCCWQEWSLTLIELSCVKFPENEAEQFGWMESVALLSLYADNHEFLQELEDFFDLESISWYWWEEIEISEMWVGEFHHDHGIELDIEFESFGVLIEEVNESVHGESFFVSLLGDDHGFVDVIFL